MEQSVSIWRSACQQSQIDSTVFAAASHGRSAPSGRQQHTCVAACCGYCAATFGTVNDSGGLRGAWARQPMLAVVCSLLAVCRF